MHLHLLAKLNTCNLLMYSIYVHFIYFSSKFSTADYYSLFCFIFQSNQCPKAIFYCSCFLFRIETVLITQYQILFDLLFISLPQNLPLISYSIRWYIINTIKSSSIASLLFVKFLLKFLEKFSYWDYLQQIALFYLLIRCTI